MTVFENIQNERFEVVVYICETKVEEDQILELFFKFQKIKIG